MDFEKLFDCSLDYPPVPEKWNEERYNELVNQELIEEKLVELKLLLRPLFVSCFPEDDNFLLQFLRVRKFDVKRAATLCENFFRQIHRCKHLFENDDIPSLIRKVSNCKCFGILPSRDHDGCVVIVILSEFWDIQKLSVREFQQAILFTIIQCIRSSLTQVAGFKIINDCSGYSFSHTMRISPRSLWYIIESMQNCIPCPIKASYCINVNIVYQHLWTIAKLFLKQKLKERVYFFRSNLHNFHETFPVESLPDELGGTAGHFTTEPWQELMHDFHQYFAFVKQYSLK